LIDLKLNFVRIVRVRSTEDRKIRKIPRRVVKKADKKPEAAKTE